MLANRRLSRAISELGLYEFRRQLKYKSVKRGNNLIIVDRWFPSSKTCSCCGNVKETLLLSERIYKCTECGFILDRDLNAAINLENQIPLAQREFTTAEI
jgi:putative transposase